MRRRRPAALLLLVLTACLLGCSDEMERESPVKLDDLPAPALEAARKQLPGVKLREAWTLKDRDTGRPAFEVRGTTPQGRTRDVRVTPDGTVLEID